MPTVDKRQGRTTFDHGGDDLSDEVNKIQSDLRNLRATVSGLADKGLSGAQNKVKDTVYEAEDAVRRNPFSAVAIAVGLGFLLGIFLRR